MQRAPNLLNAEGKTSQRRVVKNIGGHGKARGWPCLQFTRLPARVREQVRVQVPINGLKLRPLGPRGAYSALLSGAGDKEQLLRQRRAAPMRHTGGAHVANARGACSKECSIVVRMGRQPGSIVAYE